MSIKAMIMAMGLSLSLVGGANAMPVVDTGTGVVRGLIKVQYYDRGGYEGEREERGLLDIPGEIVGGAFDTAEGVLGAGEEAVGARGNGSEACARRFRSFDPETGTIRTRSGQMVQCPYLND